MILPNLSKFKLLLIGCICLGVVFGIAVWASGKKMSTSEALKIRVLSQTENVSITELQPREEGFVTLKITNASQQTILAYTLSLGRSSEITSFTFSLAPGDSRNERIAISNLEELPGDRYVREVTLAAVYLADGTTEGNSPHSSRLQNWMLGIREQAEHSLSALYAGSSSTESNSELLIEKLTGEINKSGEIIDHFNVPSDRLSGRALIKEKVARRLNELNTRKGASIQEVKEQIKAFTRDIEETAGSRHIRKEQGEQNQKPQTRFSSPRVSLRLYPVSVNFFPAFLTCRRKFVPA